MIGTIALVLLAGLGATVAMDRLAAVSRLSGLTVGANSRWIGRWFLGLRRGWLRSPDIRAAWPIPGETRAAKVGHYAIGIALGAAYLLGTCLLGLPGGDLRVALAFGFATNVFPWLLMFPAMGFGFFGHKGPPGSRLFLSSLLNHLYFGVGLWAVAQVIAPCPV